MHPKYSLETIDCEVKGCVVVLALPPSPPPFAAVVPVLLRLFSRLGHFTTRVSLYSSTIMIPALRARVGWAHRLVPFTFVLRISSPDMRKQRGNPSVCTNASPPPLRTQPDNYYSVLHVRLPTNSCLPLSDFAYLFAFVFCFFRILRANRTFDTIQRCMTGFVTRCSSTSTRFNGLSPLSISTGGFRYSSG